MWKYKCFFIDFNKKKDSNIVFTNVKFFNSSNRFLSRLQNNTTIITSYHRSF